MSYLPQSDQTGVSYDLKNGGWMARIFVAGRQHYLGLFKAESEAIRARQQAEKNRKQFLCTPSRGLKRRLSTFRFDPFRLIGEERFFNNYQSLFAYYRGYRGRDAAIERMEDAEDSFNDDVEDAREMLRLKHSGAFPVR